MFDARFRENRYRKEKGVLRKSLKEASGLDETAFRDFLSCFHFDLKQPSWKELEEHIRMVLLDHKLGISDPLVFADLKALMERHAIEIAEPITPALLNTLLQKSHRRYLLPQVFQVDKARYIEPPSLATQLDSLLAAADGDYIVVTGPPGSGKSTALSEYFDALEKRKPELLNVIRYFSFIKVHDNRQQLRLEAKSLRVNLLTELQRVCPAELRARRFDFSEERFVEVLDMLGKHFEQQGRKLVVFVDGLDHVERDQQIRDSILQALPAKVPSGIVFVIGTQELHHWQPLALRQGREKRHIQMPLFSYEQTRAYVLASSKVSLCEATVKVVHERSGGLPLYLHYVMEIAATSDNPEQAIQDIPGAANGDIRSYYQMLWSAFDAEGRSDAKHLCAVLCNLRFSVHEGEIYGFQWLIPDRPRFDEAYRRVRHLLQTKRDLVSIFHNSFQVFVIGNVDSTTKREIATAVLKKLKDEQLSSPRWFRYAFQYAVDAGDHQYVLDHVHREFVENALLHFRPEDEIMQSIGFAIDAAAAMNDLVALSRLGSLAFRTNQLLEFEFSWFLLAETLVYQGRLHDVIDSVYSEDTGRLLTSRGYALGVALTLYDIGKVELAERLFDAVLSDNPVFENKSEIVTFARCAGLFLRGVSKPLRWIANVHLKPETLEADDMAPGYAPHLAAYLEGIIAIGRDRLLQRLKRVGKPFANNLLRHLIIRALANHKPAGELRQEIEEYVAFHPNQPNLELAYFAAKAGLPPGFVNQLGGTFQFPPEAVTDGTLRRELENHLRRFAYWAVLFGYEQSDECARQIRGRVSHPRAVWFCAKNHLLIVGELLGSHFASRNAAWFSLAEHAIVTLETAGQVPGERTPDALDALRSILPESLLWMSSVLVARCPERLDDWAKVLLRLRASFIWTTHYGINEQIADYSFELAIWNNQSNLDAMRSLLRPILVDCVRSYGEALRLKGGARSHHFLAIASLAAKCGYRTDAEAWMKRGIETSLAYGYRKDITLQLLTDVAGTVDSHYPDRTLSNCAAILEMVKWISSVTDGRDTGHFAQYLFPLVLRRNRCAGLQLLRRYYERFAEWKAEESLQKYLLSRLDSDPEFLWALASLLHPNDSLEVREHIAHLEQSADSAPKWQRRVSRFILTMINPRHWPEDLWATIDHHERPQRGWRQAGTTLEELQAKSYQFDGASVGIDEVRQLCLSSFEGMKATIQKLKDQNEHVSEYDLIREALPGHIDGAATVEILDGIGLFIRHQTTWADAPQLERLGRRYLALGQVEKGLSALEDAIGRLMDYGEDIRAPFATLATYDRQRARTSLVSKIQHALESAPRGFKMPRTVAVACDILGEVENLGQIFDDFLRHCQELFAQLPADRWFDELRDWTETERDEKAQIVDVLIDRLQSPAIESSFRLLSAICELCSTSGNYVLPTLMRRAAGAKGMQLYRVLTIVLWLGAKHPSSLQDHCEPLLQLLNRKNAFVRLSLVKSLRSAFGETPLPETIRQEVEAVQRLYAATVSYRGFGLLYVEPSAEFRKLVWEGTTDGLRRRLLTACNILNVDRSAIMANLERMLLSSGSTMENEREDIQAMWQTHAHTQGWPVISFIPDFEAKVSDFMYETLDEILTKQSHAEHRVNVLWNVLNPCDPDYVSYELLPKPGDIRPLIVGDNEEWLSGNSGVTVDIRETQSTEWITVFEFRQLAQDDPYHVPYLVQTHVRSAFVLPEIVQQIGSLESSIPWQEDLELQEPGENISWDTFRQAVSEPSQEPMNAKSPSLPAVAVSLTHADFLGFHTLASFSSLVFESVTLTCRGFDVFRDAERVGFFEAWQEGYPDEEYNDQPMAYGVRFRAQAKFIQQLCQLWGRAFAVRETEHRWLFKSFQRDPVRSKSLTKITVLPFV
jgi:nucleoside-triphosphatase THEP1